jgi:2-hydroxychromene-2-carboxylate isomerase
VKHVDFFYDFACPYAYLAHGRVDAACARHGASVAWRPFLLGGVFRAIGTPDRPGDHMPPSKARMNLLDMHRWAAFHGVPFRMPETHPNRTVLALRAAMASGDLVRASEALFTAYWAFGLDVSKAETVRAALDRAGFDGAALVAKAEEPAIKDALRRATDEAIAAGVFGAPAFVVTIREEPGRADAVELFWGQDRIVLVEEMLAGASASATDTATATATATATDTATDTATATDADTDTAARAGALEFWFDFSSPFAYLASVRVEDVARRAGVELVYRPFLLGGLFQAIGTPNVPLFEMPEPKKRHAVADMGRWAARFGAPFVFPTRFPMVTVKALRMVLALPDEARAPLVNAIYRAFWAEDRDISDAAVLADIATRAGLDGPALAARTGDDSLKRALREATDEAARRGVFGAPSFFAGDLLFWGQDRLDLVEKALGGWRPPGE